MKQSGSLLSVGLFLYACMASAGPELLAPGIVSTNAGEYSPTFDEKRGELVFMRRTPGKMDYTLYSSRLESEGWTIPTILPFSGRFRDAGPSFSPDGERLVFDSRRPADQGGDDTISLWQAERNGDSWTQPVPLAGLSRNEKDEPDVGRDEFGPTEAGDGSIWFYAFRRPFRGGAFYRSVDGSTVTREASLPDPSYPTFVAYPSFSVDGKTAVIEGRSKRGGDTDLFFACRTASGWSEARRLEAVNSEAGEGTPSLSSDGKTLYFASSRPVAGDDAGSSNIFAISTDELPIPCN